MRDLHNHPITDDEIIRELELIQQETAKWYEESMICGNLRGAIIAELILRTKGKKE